jgi:guanosine-3',5'-bis(diphosphate) 3'-pyrophosphohydrolase
MLSKEEQLQKVRDFADAAHGEQMRRYAPQDRYIVHPERVMQICKVYNGSVPMLAAALLHDVLEDTSVTKGELKEFLLGIMENDDVEHTVRSVEELTDIYTKDNYPKWNRRKRRGMEAERLSKASAEAHTIKYADILDNIHDLPADDDFSLVFLRESRSLLKQLSKGNPELYHQVSQEVNKKIRELEM